MREFEENWGRGWNFGPPLLRPQILALASLGDLVFRLLGHPLSRALHAVGVIDA